jgi:hypothetical protein
LNSQVTLIGVNIWFEADPAVSVCKFYHCSVLINIVFDEDLELSFEKETFCSEGKLSYSLDWSVELDSELICSNRVVFIRPKSIVEFKRLAIFFPKITGVVLLKQNIFVPYVTSVHRNNRCELPLEI